MADNFSSTAAALVPQIFFDIIARFMGGLISLAFFYVSIRGPTCSLEKLVSILSGDNSIANPVFVFLAISSAAYAISFLAWGAWAGLCFIASASLESANRFYNKRRKSKRIPQIMRFFLYPFVLAKKTYKNSHVETEPFQYGMRQEFAVRYDYIKLCEPSTGSRISKLKAEVHLAGILIVVGFLCIGISIFQSYINSLSTAFCFACLTFSAIGAYWYISRRVRSAVNNVYELLKSGECTGSECS